MNFLRGLFGGEGGGGWEAYNFIEAVLLRNEAPWLSISSYADNEKSIELVDIFFGSA